MLNLVVTESTSGIQTMSSIDLAALCVGDAKNAHYHFISKMKLVIGEKGVLKFRDSYLSKQNKPLDCYNLPEREACLMAMSYSYELQAKVYDAWQALKSQVPSWYKELSPQATIAIEDLSRQRDEAIKTKAQINDKRTATLMNKASQDSKRIKKLEMQVQDAGSHRSMLAEKLSTYIQVAGKKKSVAAILRNISEDMELPRQKVACERYGSVWAYHVEVIAQFKEMYL